MQDKSDAELLREYARGNDAAFREIVTRHADLVYASALRQARSPELARDIAQTVFSDLVRKAPALAQSLPDTASLVGWLYRSTRFEAHTQMRDERRRQARERQAMQEFDPTPETATAWERVGPVLDEAMADLNDEDRDALLLRFFKNHDFRTIGAALGVSDDTAQKRVSRALDRLRAEFNRRGVTTSAMALTAALSANAVAAGPAGLAATLSSAALTSSTLTATATATATKAIAMTTLQKTIIGATLAVAVGTGIYEAREASNARAEVETLRQQRAPLAEQIQRLNEAFMDATNQLAALRSENERLQGSASELLKLRGEVNVLRRQLADAGDGKSELAQPALSSAREYYERAFRHGMDREYEAQLDDLNKALELDPNLADAYLARAGLFASLLPKKKQSFEKAVADYTRFLEFKPRDAATRYNRAFYYERLQQYDNAIAGWTTFIEGDTDFSLMAGVKKRNLPRGYAERGHLYHLQKKDYLKAIADYTAALNLDSESEGVHRLRGQCYELLGQMDKAQQDFAVEPKNN